MITPDAKVTYFDGFQLEVQPGWTVLKVTDTWTGEAAAMAASGQVDELRLNYAWGFKEPTLDFIDDWPLKKIFVLARWLDDLTPIHRLGATLEGISTEVAAKADIDLAYLPGLRKVVADWPVVKKSFSALTHLTELFIFSFKEADLTPLVGNLGLTSLRMKQYPQVRSVEGIEELAHLEQLQIVVATKLEDLSALRHTPSKEHLRDLDFDTCKRITTVDDIAALTSLEKLNLGNCGTLESLKPLTALHRLRQIRLYESTVVADGDLSPLLEKPALKSINLTNRRHYQPTVKQVETALKARDRAV